jgi:hypothetical protein
MKILETSFRKKGFFHELVYREKEWAIYKRTRVLQNTETHHYEVIRVKIHPAYELAGISFVESEGYPSSEMWGTLGWTVATEPLARQKLEEARVHQKQLDLAAKKRNK